MLPLPRLRQLESQVRQLRLRAESEAADATKVKAELETAQADRVSLQKKIGLLTRQNEDLSAENGGQCSERSNIKLCRSIVMAEVTPPPNTHTRDVES